MKDQLGRNTTTDVRTPIEVLGVGGSGFLSGMVSVGGGSQHTCALSSTGNVYCWGYNLNGQLGNNSTTDQHIPDEVLGVGGAGYLSNIVSISVGNNHTCALSDDGHIYCWGINSNGGLGQNSTSDAYLPVEVVGLSNVGFLSNIIQVSSGSGWSCAVSGAGNVYCWGYNSSGQLGINNTTQQLVPVQVKGVGGSGVLGGVTSVSAGTNHSCALTSSGTVYCWGYNKYGQLGNYSNSNFYTPVQVVGTSHTGTLSGMVSIGTQYNNSCAISSAGNVYCWGSNALGSLGINSTTNTNYPTKVFGVGAVGYLSGVRTP